MQDIIAQLLVRDPEKRLGSRAGAEEVKAHPFFSEIDWGLLRNTRSAPPTLCIQTHTLSICSNAVTLHTAMQHVLWQLACGNIPGRAVLWLVG